MIWFEENGGEYVDCLDIDCKSLKQIDNQTIEVNNAFIKFPESIISIDKLEGSK